MKIHISKYKNTIKEEDLESLCYACSGFVGADLESVVKSAYILALEKEN